MDEYLRRHHNRYKKFVETRENRLSCQDCGGRGEFVDDVIAGYCLYVECGWCEGTGLLTPHLRSLWLRERRKLKIMNLQKVADTIIKKYPNVSDAEVKLYCKEKGLNAVDVLQVEKIIEYKTGKRNSPVFKT